MKTVIVSLICACVFTISISGCHRRIMIGTNDILIEGGRSISTGSYNFCLGPESCRHIVTTDCAVDIRHLSSLSKRHRESIQNGYLYWFPVFQKAYREIREKCGGQEVEPLDQFSIRTWGVSLNGNENNRQPAK